MYSRIGAAFVAAALAFGIQPAFSAGPTDPQIAHIAYTAGDIDIKAAQLALKISKNPEVTVASAALNSRVHFKA